MDERTPGYYAIIPASVRYDDQIPANAKLLYGEISALAEADGYCYAGNTYFAELYKVSERTITGLISALRKNGHIDIQQVKGEADKKQYRKILLTPSTADGQGVENIFHGGRKNFLPNNISIKEINKESSPVPATKTERTAKTEFDPRPLFVEWIDTVLPKVCPGVIVPPQDKNALYIALINFTENRHALKKPIPSKAAVTALMNRLKKFTDKAAYRVDAMIDLLETATSSNWQTVYEAKSHSAAKAQKPQGGRVYEEL